MVAEVVGALEMKRGKMKKVYLILTSCLLSISFAFDYQQILKTSQPIVAIIEDIEPSVRAFINYLPGYGVHISAEQTEIMSFPNFIEQSTIEELVPSLSALCPTVKGLDEGEKVSISFKQKGLMGNQGYTLLITCQNGIDPELKVFKWP